MPPAVLRRIGQAHPDTEIFLMYGLTEAFRSTYLPPAELADHPTSIGRAIPETEILVLDAAGRPCADGEIGELVHRGPTVAAGYWDDPEATAEVFRPFRLGPPGGWPEYVVHSGDYVRRDSDGLLYFVERRDEQFKSRGHRVGATQIEAALMDSGLLREAVVFADPTADGDPEITAVVAPAADGRHVEAALLSHCRATMPNYLWPGRVVVVEEIPRGPTGKLDRVRVRDEHGAGKAT
jgi:acyl-CoA synthetase (AMP-forming)/AMP-acid ligase II